MHRRIVTTGVAAALASACGRAPPAAPAAVSVSAEPSSRAVGTGVGVDLTIASVPAPPPAFALDAPADVVLRWTGPATLAVRSPDGITTTCEESPCLLPLALPGAYHAEARSGWHEPPPAPARVAVRALAPPATSVLTPGGRPLELRLGQAAPDDPRGAFADASLHLPIAAHVELELTEAGGGPADSEERLARLQVHVVGATGPIMTIASAPDASRAVRYELDASAGDYTLRVSAGADDVRVVRAVLLPQRPPVNPPSTARPAPAPPSVPRLRGDDRTIVVAPLPESPSVAIETNADHDLALMWTPPDAPVFLTHPDVEASCQPSPCVEARWRGGTTALSLPPGSPAVRLHARQWPLPTPAGVVHPGGSLELTTRAAADDDPRGPLAEVEVVLDRDGTYLVSARDLDWVPPADWRAADLPDVTEFGLDGAYPMHPFGVLTGEEQLRTGTGVDLFELDAPARVMVRIDGRGPRAPRRVLVTVERR